MSKSLKSFIPVLSRILNESTESLYERQRALVREGLLSAPAGRGPGSGVRATADSVAVLLIGMVSSTNLAGAGPAARTIAEACSVKAKCPLTGATSARDAIGRVLASPSLAKRLREIRFGVTHGTVAIVFDGDKLSEFVGKSASKGLYRQKDGIRMDLTINAPMMYALSKATSEVLAEDPD